MAWVYVLESNAESHYIGSTVDVAQRLKRHNAGTGARTTSGKIWKVVYQKEYSTLDEARRDEKRIKSWKGGNAFKKLLHVHRQITD
jgi:putative endonuclease